MFWRRLKHDCQLIVPDDMGVLDVAVLSQLLTIVNGHSLLVPSTIWWMPTLRSEGVRRWMYQHGKTDDDFKRANSVWRTNTLRLIKACGGPRWLQRERITDTQLVWEHLQQQGGPEFWHEKTPRGSGALILKEGTDLNKDAADIIATARGTWTEKR